MAAYTKFDVFTFDLAAGTHHWNTDTYKIALSLSAPITSNTVLADITQIANGGGYLTGGTLMPTVLSTSGGIAKVVATNVIFTGSGGGMAPFRYPVIYNDTAGGDPLVGFADAGATITLNAGDTFTIAFSPSNGLLTVGP